MAFILVSLFILQILAAYFSAKCVYYATNQKWLEVLIVFLSSLAPFSFGFLRNSLKYQQIVDFLCKLSHFYLGFIIYFFMACCCARLIHKINADIDFRKLMICGFCVTPLILVGGFINAMNPRSKKVILPSQFAPRICFASDIHVGSIGTTTTLSKVSNLIDSMHPDLVIFGGDILDFYRETDYNDVFLKTMREITGKYRTYAVIGNHEVYAGLEKCIKLLKEAGINVLIDDCVEIDVGELRSINPNNAGNRDNKAYIPSKIRIVGRLDGSIIRRKSLAEIIATADMRGNERDAPANSEIPTIVVEHTPKSIDESVENGVFLHLSGHTHKGQVFPLNFIPDLIYKKTGVLHKDRNTYSYISVGAGFWGPPYRVGNTPEVVLIEGK